MHIYIYIYTVYIIIHYMARRHYILIDLLYPNTSNCYIYIYTHTHHSLLFPLYIPTIICIYIYIHIYINICLYHYIFISIYIYIYTYTYICMYIYTYFKFQHTHTHIYIYIVVDSPLYPQIINPPNAQATVETSIAGTKVLRGWWPDHGSVMGKSTVSMAVETKMALENQNL